MNIHEIRCLLGGHGDRRYSSEVARTPRGTAWYDGTLIAVGVVGNWQEIAVADAISMMELAGVVFSADEQSARWFTGSLS